MRYQARLMMAVVVLAGIGVAQAASVMRAGEWKITTKVVMPGMASFPARAMTQTICYTPKALGNLRKWASQASGAHQATACKRVAFHVAGNTATWTTRCSGPHPAVSTGRVSYHADAYRGTLNMSMPNPRGGQMTMVEHFTGRRIGPCR
ncbi:MAG: DUF3617 domain-containing protein [Acidiferrobacteraceae bacterium]